MTTLSDKTVVTRKQHQCAWCGTSIAVDTAAQYRSYMFEGDFTTDYMHLDCRDAMGNSDFRDDEGFTPGQFEYGKTADESMQPDKRRER